MCIAVNMILKRVLKSLKEVQFVFNYVVASFRTDQKGKLDRSLAIEVESVSVWIQLIKRDSKSADYPNYRRYYIF